MIKSNEFMDALEKIIVNAGEFPADLYPVGGSWDECTSKSDGSSYDGFINFTDGFLVRESYFDPFRDEIYLCGVDEASTERAALVQKVIDELEDKTFALESYYRDNEDELKEKHPTVEAFKKYYYDADMEDEDWYKIDDDILSWYDESPAFLGVRVLLYDGDNRRIGGDKKTCLVQSFVNDDLGYGRESVGSWAGKNCIGEGIGNHFVYEKTFEWNDLKDLSKQLEEIMPLAYRSLGGC